MLSKAMKGRIAGIKQQGRPRMKMLYWMYEEGNKNAANFQSYSKRYETEKN